MRCVLVWCVHEVTIVELVFGVAWCSLFRFRVASCGHWCDLTNVRSRVCGLPTLYLFLLLFC